MAEIKLPKERNLYFTKQVNQESIAELTKNILDINTDDAFITKQAELFGFTYNPEPIKLYIDSYGGAVYQILGCISIIENSKTPIHTIATGVAMSCGFMLLISGHKRYCYKYSTPLYHQVSSVKWGKLKDLEEDLEETKRLQKILEKLTLEKTKITKQKLKQVFEGKRDWYMTPIEAKKLGVVDEIL
jgi:ATP-dependent Clp protease protease subunit